MIRVNLDKIASAAKNAPITHDAYMTEEIVAKAAKYIKENYHQEDLSLKKVSSDVCLSYYYLSRMFKRELGMSFVDYLSKVRLKAAVSMLKNLRLNISQVAFAVGYQDPHYFSKVFKKRMKVSPFEFRKRYLSTNNRKKDRRGS